MTPLWRDVERWSVPAVPPELDAAIRVLRRSPAYYRVVRSVTGVLGSLSIIPFGPLILHLTHTPLRPALFLAVCWTATVCWVLGRFVLSCRGLAEHRSRILGLAATTIGRTRARRLLVALVWRDGCRIPPFDLRDRDRPVLDAVAERLIPVDWRTPLRDRGWRR